ncbi:MAG: sigma-54 dependent transcriptional regulator [bacterium]|nr:sigma-54 dependent transcriptional regulator [bacterium]
MRSIIVIDDEESMCICLAIILRKEGYRVQYATHPEKAIELIKMHPFDLALLDIKMPGMSGLDLLKIIKETSPETVVIMMTAYASTETAVRAIKSGAYDYLTKPFKDNNEVKHIIRNALEKKQLTEENLALRTELSELRDQYRLDNLVGKSKKMREIFSIIRKIADSTSTVLITGESGTGKELVARAIHNCSRRREKPLVSLNCGAMPEGLLESELFGHVKGAFTGAISTKKGLFEMADGGTLFLDEIGTTPLSIQVKLLRVLQDREIRRVGSTEGIQIDVRLIAATNIDIKSAICAGTFREDLYYRLNVIPIHLPPLREREEDIPLLVEHFLRQFNKKSSRGPKAISSEAMQLLCAYSWPGNVREMENTIERAVALAAQDIIQPEDLPENIRRSATIETPVIDYNLEQGVDLEKIMDSLEKSLIFQALDKSKGNKTKAAELLNLSFRSFRYRLKKYDHSQ